MTPSKYCRHSCDLVRDKPWHQQEGLGRMQTVAERDIPAFVSSSENFFPFKSVPPSHSTCIESNEEK